MNDIPILALKSILQPVRTRLVTSLCPAWLRTKATILVIVLNKHVVLGAPRQGGTLILGALPLVDGQILENHRVGSTKVQC